jgi:dGTPase
VIDHISGMTDVYALDLYRKLNGMSLPAVWEDIFFYNE